MRPEHDSDGEFATAVAASAFAICSREEHLRDLRIGSGNPLSRAKTKNDQHSRPTGPSSTRSPYGQDNKASSSLRTVHSTKKDAMQQGNSKGDTNAELKADIWEKVQMEKIKKRYDKMQSDVLAWENEEKARAKLQLEKKKNELVHRRDRYLQHYQVQIAKIDHIAQGAKKQVEDGKKSKESSVKERAKKLRSSGKAPVCCFC